METSSELMKWVGWQILDLSPPDIPCLTSVDNNPVDQIEILWTTLLDHVPCAIAVVDLANKLTRFNRKFCALVGYSPVELTNRQLGELVHILGQRSEGTSIDGAVGFPSLCTEGEQVCVLMKADGLTTWCRRTIVPCGEQTKKSGWIICYFEELTDSTDALQILVESHKRFVERQSAQMEMLGAELQTVERLATEIKGEQAILLERQINQLMGWLAPLRQSGSVDDSTGMLVESAYRSAAQLQQLVAVSGG
ncbi:MAG TPA: PAS domain S-box protein [Pirellulales bacterium]|jgi:PAS domain S-box-containing protein|nr:PAS domain S-box protein [Pirellulales bacterium]